MTNGQTTINHRLLFSNPTAADEENRNQSMEWETNTRHSVNIERSLVGFPVAVYTKLFSYDLTPVYESTNQFCDDFCD